MKILILSWRDIKSPHGGGAEIFTFENAKRWVSAGNEVTWFTSGYGDQKREEDIDGVKIIRRGSEVTVHLHAFLCYRKLFKGKFDLVIDQINTIPFLTPLYVKEKKIALIFQLAREIWFYETFFPLSLIGFVLEFLYLKIYRNTPVMTISESTRQDLLNLKFSGDIAILPVGISFKPLERISDKEPNPTLIFFCRLRNSKRIHHIIEALSIAKQKIPRIQLRIVGGKGKPDYKRRVDSLVKKLGLENNIIFHGHVDEAAKRSLIAQSHILAVTSVREGWGLVVSEANALGTIAIGYNVPGIKDSIIDGKTGLLTGKNNPDSLAQKILDCLSDKELYQRLRQSALEQVRKLSWEESAQESLSQLRKITSRL